MPLTSVKLSNGSRNDILNFIKSQKSQKSFKVIDVGGGIYSWCSEYLDALVDICPNNKNNKFTIYEGDINDEKVWTNVLAYTEKYGKYDFCICTHTLEDIRNPLFVSKQIEKIAKAGYIAVPSKYTELSRFEFGPNCHRGYIHHRWIFDIIDNKMVGYPKLTIIEYMNDLDKIASLDHNIRDLNFIWHDNIDLQLYNKDYMGPDAQSVVTYLNSLTTNNDVDRS